MFQWGMLVCSVVVVFVNTVSAIYIVRFVRIGIPNLREMERALTILKADVLITRRQRAREKLGGASMWETTEEYKARIKKEDNDLTPEPEEINNSP